MHSGQISVFLINIVSKEKYSLYLISEFFDYIKQVLLVLISSIYISGDFENYDIV